MDHHYSCCIGMATMRFGCSDGNIFSKSLPKLSQSIPHGNEFGTLEGKSDSAPAPRLIGGNDASIFSSRGPNASQNGNASSFGSMAPLIHRMPRFAHSFASCRTIHAARLRRRYFWERISKRPCRRRHGMKLQVQIPLQEQQECVSSACREI